MIDIDYSRLGVAVLGNFALLASHDYLFLN